MTFNFVNCSAIFFRKSKLFHHFIQTRKVLVSLESIHIETLTWFLGLEPFSRIQLPLIAHRSMLLDPQRGIHIPDGIHICIHPFQIHDQGLEHTRKQNPTTQVKLKLSNDFIQIFIRMTISHRIYACP